jgi:hypothetical protein
MRLFIGLFVTAASALFLTADGAKSPAPESMTKMVVRLMGPGIKPKSFAALPKTIYRAGPHYARIEDPPDARQQIHKLTIIAEPDAYSINLIDKKGTHAIDQGNPHGLHLPVVLPFDPKHQLGKLDQLEFGDEEDFFKDAGAAPEPGPTVNAKPTDALRLKIPGGSATLVLRAATHEPVFLSWQTKEGTYKYEYIEYKDLPFDSKLFTKPAGITYKEIPPDKDGEVG